LDWESIVKSADDARAGKRRAWQAGASSDSLIMEAKT
jgi:hypothetical protein